ncbi:MAG: type 4a pilus biogenesis protein PilO [Deltaproteobacteria bacterium]|jgi:type IV pilus assembly protein PilO|nr:type 4a pilus biogenesis protein PilO [Deltaproteobacteria bacterium]MBW2565496.1 type 4a pilus biogenesis protein PilO [Deltaproteobacteria bacterium]
MAKLSLPSFPFEKIEAIGRLQRILICVGLFLVLGGGFYYLIYMPKSASINELRDEYETLEGKLFTARKAAENLEQFEKDYADAQVKFKLALQLLPDKREIPSLLESVTRSGKESGLEFKLFQPSGEVVRGFYAEIPVNIQISGGYHNLAMFFDRVARLSRIVNIMNLTLNSAGGTAAILNASCVARTYRFLEAAPAAGAQ